MIGVPRRGRQRKYWCKVSKICSKRKLFTLGVAGEGID